MFACSFMFIPGNLDDEFYALETARVIVLDDDVNVPLLREILWRRSVLGDCFIVAIGRACSLLGLDSKSTTSPCFSLLPCVLGAAGWGWTSLYEETRLVAERLGLLSLSGPLSLHRSLRGCSSHEKDEARKPGRTTEAIAAGHVICHRLVAPQVACNGPVLCNGKMSLHASLQQRRDVAGLGLLPGAAVEVCPIRFESDDLVVPSSSDFARMNTGARRMMLEHEEIEEAGLLELDGFQEAVLASLLANK